MSELGEKLIGIVRAKAAERPDFVYDIPGGEDGSCVYISDGQPSCLIGHALLEAGVIDPDFEFSSLNHAGIAQLRISHSFNEHEVSLSEFCWLQEVQRRQDIGSPWGYAVMKADEEVPL